MQFHSFKDPVLSTTISAAILHKSVSDASTWLNYSFQLFEALWYLHDDIGITHNDLKGDNILITVF